MTIRYQIVENNLQPGTYYARVVDKGVYGLDDMMPNIITKTSLNEPDVRAVILAIASEVQDVLADGDTVVIEGLFSATLTLSGSFAKAETAVNTQNATININVTIDGGIAKAVQSQATFEQVPVTVKVPSISRFIDVANKTENRYTAGSIITIQGNNLRFDENDATQGVFITSGGNTTRLSVYSLVGGSQIDALMPAGVTGNIEVEIRARYTEAGELRSGKYAQAVTPA